MHDAVHRPMPLEILAQHAYNIGFRLAAMDDHRQFLFPGELQMASKEILLLRKWRVIPVAVQAGLSHRDDFLRINQS